MAAATSVSRTDVAALQAKVTTVPHTCVPASMTLGSRASLAVTILAAQ